MMTIVSTLHKNKWGLVLAVLLSGMALSVNAPAQQTAPQQTKPDPDKLRSVVKSQSDIDTQNRGSQQTIDKLADDTQRMLDDYQLTLRETDSLRAYNDYLQKMVAAQETEIASIDRQLNEIETTNRGVVPLMARMIDSLDQFIQLDAPFLPGERKERLAQLRDLMDRADITVSEKYRRVMEAYQIETDYGRTIEAYRDTLKTNGGDRSVDFLRIGRVTLIYQTLDGKEAGIWNQKEGNWNLLPDDYRRSVTQGLRIARKQAAPDLLRLPIPAPEAAQ